MASSSLDLIRCGFTAAAMIAAPVVAQSAPERGVFITQIGDGNRGTVTQTNSQSLARVVQDGNDNQASLDQDGAAAHRAQIAQNGDGNIAGAQQDGDGSTELAVVQDGNGNVANVLQREVSAGEQTKAAILQRGNDNRVLLAQNGSDNDALLEQNGDGNSMNVTQLDSGNRIVWTQTGDGLSGADIIQSGGANIQITQTNAGSVQFMPPPPGTGR